MARGNYARYFHQDFFENPSSGSLSENSNIDIPVIAKVKQVESYKQVIEEIKPSPEEKQETSNLIKESVLFNRAPNFFETHYHIQKVFWVVLLALALIPVLKSGFMTFFSLSQNLGKNFELRKIQNKLNTDKKDIENKFKNYHSHSGMKRTIKEEIKVIEENEILIKIVK